MENTDTNNIMLFILLNKTFCGENYNLIKIVIFLQEVQHRKSKGLNTKIHLLWGDELSDGDWRLKAHTCRQALSPPGNSRSLLARPHTMSPEASLSPWDIVGSIFHPRRNTTRSTRSFCGQGHGSSPPRCEPANVSSGALRSLFQSQLAFSLTSGLEEVGGCWYRAASFPLKKLLLFSLKGAL